jgi:hypothetical protein
MLQHLECFSFATSLDLHSMGYYSIRLDPDAQKMCTIVSPFGKYQFVSLPMGISRSPDILWENMSILMQHVEIARTCRTYLDAMLVVSGSTFEDHVQKLEVVLKLI